MGYLAPATDVHDEFDLVTIPSLGRPIRRLESPLDVKRVPLGRRVGGVRMPPPQSWYLPSQYTRAPERTEVRA